MPGPGAAMEGPPLVATGAGEMPLSVRRLLATARGQGVAGLERLVDGWFVEPVLVPDRQVWVWGAGHVGRALVAVLAPLPGMAVTWVDVAPERFPDLVPEGVTPVWAARPEDLVAHAPQAAEHLILTYSHALDLELCHRLLVRGFRSCGLIGSATKWARFRSRLAALGHDPAVGGAHPLPDRRSGAGQASAGDRGGRCSRADPARQHGIGEGEDGMTTERPELLRVEGITKAYPGVVANSDVSFTISEGEVHALLGENGAGKSTLVKMIYGLVKPDQGRMTLRGRPYTPSKPAEARRLGVAMVFQHFSLFEALNVAENVALGMESPPPMRELAARIRAVSEEYGLPLDPARMVGDLSRRRAAAGRDHPLPVAGPQAVDHGRTDHPC
jgi:hypothetical protein